MVPDARLIAVLRDPVARAVSGYHHAVRFGNERRPIEVALDPVNEERLANVADDAWYDDPELAGAAARLLRARALRGAAGALVGAVPTGAAARRRDRALRAGDAMRRCSSSSGSTSRPTAAATPDRNVGSYAPPPLAVTDRLAAYFAPHNERLFTLLGARWDWAT